MLEFAEFGRERIARAAGSVALGIAALNHEPIDYAVKDETVIEALADARQHAVDMDGSDIVVEFQNHGAEIGFDGDFRIIGFAFFVFLFFHFLLRFFVGRAVIGDAQ